MTLPDCFAQSSVSANIEFERPAWPVIKRNPIYTDCDETLKEKDYLVWGDLLWIEHSEMEAPSVCGDKHGFQNKWD